MNEDLNSEIDLKAQMDAYDKRDESKLEALRQSFVGNLPPAKVFLRGHTEIHYQNVKSHLIYVFVAFAEDATNGREGKSMVIYTREGATYVRDRDEFTEKFEEVVSPDEDFPGEGWQ